MPHALPPAPPVGPIDLHSHLLPGIDDGCDSLDESLEAIERLKAAGYAGTICTPHVWMELFPDNTGPNIAEWVARLRAALHQRGVDYPIWPGGEVRLFPEFINYFAQRPIPTLAGTNRVLCDMFSDDWPGWAIPALQLMTDRGYQPILAHPERINIDEDEWPQRMAEVRAMGVWLQGNFEAFTGGLGRRADGYVRRLIADDGYTFLALDMHRPYSLADRLDGRQFAIEEFGEAAVAKLSGDRVRELILSADAPADPMGVTP
ncbi:MAG: CpsB/CapC family capsule biosynthesis tyrosine phosphatase [Planctomycetota bacterium]